MKDRDEQSLAPDCGWIEQSCQSGSDLDAKDGGGNRRFELASPAERPIHLGVIQL
jgi:hypothetical protein